ncbi:hypothetical protein P152DRAFT_465238 [Eremomyces bilateralis CBS 781.70]|uniref:Casein kinase II beta 2 subunit n=1 Tax=Eremomyces bilateralis CBS 781.70 TaxID=1392243 RepID=A0A6G1G8Y6_9PEZI|nr:uncharacterized protein P152DRAFT_465238 [Eremomyces bilateralis CBS 781.70]KAF1814360.1 hypothetical protein P152DRAFT_465238 [Eremomyces bilateralis CBS 781.70]
MAPSVGTFHLLVAKNAKLLRFAWKQAAQAVQNHVPIARAIETELQPIATRIAPRTSAQRIAWLKQSGARSYASAARHGASRSFSTSQRHAAGLKYDRSKYPTSRIRSAVERFTGRAPFASTMRPNLTGGSLGRTAGGYTLGAGRVGGARHFSHGPASPAEVVRHVSQGVRAFMLEGKRAQFDGVDPVTGKHRYKEVSVLENDVSRKMSAFQPCSPGSFIDFPVNPTITALAPRHAFEGTGFTPKSMDTLNTDGLLDVLSIDFSRALKDLAIVLTDLKRLASLGDLPISYHGTIVRVHFPGCDADTVEQLCDELGIQRGIVGQDREFPAFAGTEIALLFPFAPSIVSSEADGHSLYEPRNPPDKIDYDFELFPRVRSVMSAESEDGNGPLMIPSSNPWVSSPSGYESIRTSDLEDGDARGPPRCHDPLEYQGLQGVYRFIEQCEV